MIVSRPRSRWTTLALLVPALAGMPPTVQWCALTWDQVGPEKVMRCLTAPPGGCPLSPGVGADAALRSNERTHACGAAGATCDRRSMGGAESAGRRGTRDAGCAARPAADAGPQARAVTGAPVPPPGSAPAHRRAYCLDDPVSGRALQGRSPQIQPPAVVAAPLAALTSPEPPSAPARARCDGHEARPPTWRAEAPPPARGPPPGA